MFPIQQIADLVAPVLFCCHRRPGLRCQCFGESLADHVVHYLSRRVVGTRGLAGRFARFRVVGGEQVLEDPAEQLGIKCHLPVEWRILLNREFEMTKQRKQSCIGIEEQT